MTYTIYHLLDLLNPRAGYFQVGDVKAPDLEGAFSASQNHNDNWASRDQRSTCTNDLIIDETGVQHLVLSVGFKQVSIL